MTKKTKIDLVEGLIGQRNVMVRNALLMKELYPEDISWLATFSMEGFEEPQYRKLNEGVGLYRREFGVPPAWKSLTHATPSEKGAASSHFGSMATSPVVASLYPYWSPRLKTTGLARWSA